MSIQKISIKRKKSFKRSFQKKKFVLFIGDRGIIDKSLQLDNRIAEFILSVINKKYFKNLSFNKSVILHNPLTLELNQILVIK